MGNTNKTLQAAFKAKNDEYYTLMEDVEAIVKAFSHHLKGKRVYCNCDTEESNFYRYLRDHYDELELAGLDRSFISYDDPENLEKLDACDVVITNPPFSIYSEYLPTIIDHGKDYVLIAPLSGIGTPWQYNLWKAGKLQYTRIKPTKFRTPTGEVKGVGSLVITSFTDMDRFEIEHEEKLDKNPWEYTYDNYDAIECPRLEYLPCIDAKPGDVIGVPITFITAKNRDDYEILACSGNKDSKLTVRGKQVFKRFLITPRRKGGGMAKLRINQHSCRLNTDTRFWRGSICLPL